MSELGRTLSYWHIARTSAPERAVAPDASQGRTFTDALGRRIDIAIVTTRGGFDALEQDWNDLFERAGAANGSQHVFTSFNWHWHWCNHFLRADGDACPLRIVTVRADGKLALLWPLVLSRSAGIQRLMFAGTPVSQYADILAAPDAALEELVTRSWQVIARDIPADVMVVRKVRADAVLGPLLDTLAALRLNRQQAVSIDLQSVADFETYLQRHSTRARRNRRRQMRRLEEQGSVEYRTAVPGPEAIALTNTAVAMKREWLREKKLVSTAFSDPRFGAFFAAVADEGPRQPGTRIFSLHCNGEPAAIEIAFDGVRHRAMHVIVYNQSYEKCGAGALHMQESIEQSHKDAIATFDLLAPNARYKSEWGDDLTAVSDAIVPLTWRGRVYSHLYLRLILTMAKRAAGYQPLQAVMRKLGLLA